MKKKPLLDKAAQKELKEQELLKFYALKDDVFNSISVVVQGDIIGQQTDSYQAQLTLQCLQSVKRLLPQAELILSTWNGSRVEHLPHDKLVLNDLPNEVGGRHNAHVNHVNRQIISTYNGLKAATKKYVVKLQSNCQLIDTDFIHFMREYERTEAYRFLEKRVLITSVCSKNPRKSGSLMHPGSIVQVGLLEDLLKLWNVPIITEPVKQVAFNADEYLWLSFCKVQGLNVRYGDVLIPPASAVLAAEQSLVNNFVVVKSTDMGILLPKHINFMPENRAYTHGEWYHINERYTEGAASWFKLKLLLKTYMHTIQNTFSRT
jgi:hypothetical protein